MVEKKQVLLDSDLYEDLAAKVSGTSFASVDDYVAYLLRVQLGKKAVALDEKESSAVEERLKSLGYI